MDRCERCNKYKANVHIVKVFDGIKKELNICEKCARELGEFNLNSIANVENTFSLNILGGLLEYFNNNGPQSSVIKINDSECPKCKTTYAEFKNSGFLGCDKCYDQFMKILDIFIKRVQNSSQHVGKIPFRCGEDMIARREMSSLKEELQKAINSEEYEKAAEIRDKIKNLKDKMKGGEV